VELIQEILSQVGKRHKDFGVEPTYFPHMGEALVYSLEQVLGEVQFNEAQKAAWKEVYNELSTEIIQSME
jgi:hemoglobin-like flavoprotein